MKELVNIVALQTVATGLGDLLPQVVFVGGAAIGLYASEAAAPVSRPINDLTNYLSSKGISTDKYQG